MREASMNVGVAMGASLLLLFLGYRIYGRWVGRAFGVDETRPTPAHTHRDDIDYSPTRPLVLFGHHYASIAAAGPIVGPTLALVFGVLPAWLWIVFGVIFIGAVHDFSALFMSVREEGKSIVEITRRVLGRGGFFFFISFALLLCILVSAAFVDLTARALTSMYPASELHIEAGESPLRTVNVNGEPYIIIGGVASTSVILITLFAPVLGFLLYRVRIRTSWAFILAGFVAFLSVIVGFYYPLRIQPEVWIAIILVYTAGAAYIPVWVILQPRDFTNVQFLYFGLFSIISGLLVFGLKGGVIDAPSIGQLQDATRALGSLWPFLFVTIACGAASGAHALICSGTTSKQLDSERHVVEIGYGGMLMEAVLALCVTFALSAGLGFDTYIRVAWPHIAGIEGTPNAPLAFALGVGSLLTKAFGIPILYGTIFGILILEGFLITTVDTVIRLSRYLFEELWNVLWETPPVFLRQRFVNSLLPVVLTALLAYTHGYSAIWTVFGSANQLLAALTLIVATVWLFRKSLNYWIALFPALFMVVTTMGALVKLLLRTFQQHEWILFTTALLLFGLALSFVMHSSLLFIRKNRAETHETMS